MSTEVVTVTTTAPIEDVVEKKEVTIATNENGENAPVETETKVEEKKVIDPREDPIGWISSLIPAGVHKANHEILQWIQNTAVEKEEERQPLPGKDGSVTKTQFLNFLKDGTILAKFVNAVSPGTVEKVYDGDEVKTKENQTTNIENFTKFLKEKVGLTDERIFTVADLQEKGKTGYNAVFNALFHLGLNASEKLNATGIDVDKIIESASQAVKNSFIQTILNFFKRAHPQLKTKDDTKEQPTEKVEETIPAPVIAPNGTNENGTNGTTSTPAVAAN